jgi:glutamyl-tRNA synthetase
MLNSLRGRYAPSPTGELHLGNVRTALVAWLAARASKGRFILRIEDLDPPRIIPGAEVRLLEDLRWLGLDWDEGPDVGGPFGPYRQSERENYYRTAIEKLQSSDRLYACLCSRQDLRRLASAPHGPSEEGPPYPGICREQAHPLNLKSPINPKQRLAALRFRCTPTNTCFEDQIAGSFCQNVEQAVGDFVVRRADGLYSYQLAVVVDDAAMGINQVVRGADLLASTPRQIQLQRALRLPVPSYAHVPLVLGHDGNRLAKRDRATAIRDLRESGVNSERIIGALGASLGLLDIPIPCPASELIPLFDWGKLNRHPWQLSNGVGL